MGKKYTPLQIGDSTWVTLWLVTLVTLINHNVTSGFLLSLSQGCFVFLYTCDIVVGQCHQPQCHPSATPKLVLLIAAQYIGRNFLFHHFVFLSALAS